MPSELRVPTLGESVVDATVGAWLKQEGDTVVQGEPLVELETDKVNVEVPAEQAGILTRIAKQVGDTVAIGDVLAVIDDAAAESSNAGGQAPAAAAAPQPAAAASGQSDADGQVTEADAAPEPAADPAQPAAGRWREQSRSGGTRRSGGGAVRRRQSDNPGCIATGAPGCRRACSRRG